MDVQQLADTILNLETVAREQEGEGEGGGGVSSCTCAQLMSPKTVLFCPGSSSDSSPQLTPSLSPRSHSESVWFCSTGAEQASEERAEEQKAFCDTFCDRQAGAMAAMKETKNLRGSEESGHQRRSGPSEGEGAFDSSDSWGMNSLRGEFLEGSISSLPSMRWHNYSSVEIDDGEEEDEIAAFSEGVQATAAADEHSEWSNFDKYGIDIDLFVGSSRLSPAHVSLYSTDLQATLEPSTAITHSGWLSDRFSGFRVSASEGRCCNASESSEIWTDAAEIFSGRGWTVGSPVEAVRNCDCKTRGLLQSGPLPQESYSNLESSGRQTVESQAGDQLHRARRPFGNFDWARRGGNRKGGNARFSPFSNSRSVPSSTDEPSPRRPVSQLITMSGPVLSEQQLEGQHERAKGRKGMLSSLKRWLSTHSHIARGVASKKR